MDEKKINITIPLIYLLIIFSCFPYIQVLPLGTDSQPNALFLSIILFPFCCKWKINYHLALLLLLLFFSIAVLIVSPLTFGSIRSLMNYFSLFFITYVTYYALLKSNGIPYKLFKSIVYIWFFVGTIQILFYPSFMSFLIPRGDSSMTMETGRGIVCLAPEPTFYGIVCLILGMMAYINFRDHHNIKKIYWLIIIQIIIYARSSLIIFVLLASSGLYFFLTIIANKKSRNKAIITLLCLIGGLYAVVTIYSDEISAFRIGKLLSILFEHPEKFLLLDASVNERFIHIFFPIYGFFKNWGLPHGYEHFADFMDTCFSMQQFQDLFTPYVLANPIKRIMSGWGSIFYELGVFGFILIFVIYKLFLNIATRKMSFVLFCTFCMILLNAVPFSNALIPFFMGNLLYINFKIQENGNNI